MQYPLEYQAPIVKRYSQSYPAVTLSVDIGTPVYACGDGIVVASFYHAPTFGEYIKIQHRDGISTVYAHLKEGTRQVSRGERVREGQMIGLTGLSGNASYPQLRFEVSVGNTIINPVRFFDTVFRYSQEESKTMETPVHKAYQTHTVAKGETLTAISRIYDTSLAELKKLNGISRASEIRVGQVIKIRENK